MNQRRDEFLQSQEWLAFQEAYGRKTHLIQGGSFSVGIIEHALPLVGRYFYLPRGPLIKEEEIPVFEKRIFSLAKERGVGWIRIEPETKELLEVIKKTIGDVRPSRSGISVQKAPHDVQPREIFLIDIAKSEDELLAQMKSKTRYNIRLAQKKGVVVRIISNQIPNPNSQTKSLDDHEKYTEEFLRLTDVMAKRQGIAAHPREYYRKMLQNISGDILKLYVAEYQGKIIAANLVVFCGDTCTYLHGASDDNFRNVMAPYLLQWQQICDAKKAECTRYDLGGVKVVARSGKSWEGVTKFKLGFSPTALLTNFPGSYDMIIDKKKYLAYRILQRLKNIFLNQ